MYLRRLAAACAETSRMSAFTGLRENLPDLKFLDCLHNKERAECLRVLRKKIASPMCSRRYSKFMCTCIIILILLLGTAYLNRAPRPHAKGNRWGKSAMGQILRSATFIAQPELTKSRRALFTVETVPDMNVSTPVKARRATAALRGMGVTFRKGSRAMTELMVAHIENTTTPGQLRLFLRTLHRSGVTAKADVVFLIPGSSNGEVIRSVIEEEERNFWQLMVDGQSKAPIHTSKRSKRLNLISSLEQSRMFNTSNSSICPFNSMAFWQSREEGIRGKGRRGVIWETDNLYVDGSTSEEMALAVDWGDWGSIVGFDMQDLEQDDALLGFIDDPPAQLRRWMCYKMLLGMLKTKYRTVLLAEVGEVLLLGDVLSETRSNRFDAEMYIYREDLSWNDVHQDQADQQKTPSELKAMASVENSNSEGFAGQRPAVLNAITQTQKPSAPVQAHVQKPEGRGPGDTGSRKLPFIHEIYGPGVWKKLEEEDKRRTVLGSGIIIGTMKPITSLSDAMLTEIVRVAALFRKNRQPFHDKPLLNYLVLKSAILNRKVTEKLSMFPNGAASVHSLPGSLQKSFFIRDNGSPFRALQGFNYGQLQEDVVNVILERIRTSICQSQAGLPVYQDCYPATNAIQRI